MSITSALARLAAVLLAATLSAAGVVAPGGAAASPPSPATADAEAAPAQRVAPSRGLKVRLVKPAGARVAAVVTGPRGFRKLIRRTTSWPNARPGRYQVAARVAVIFDQRVRPQVRPGTSVRVVRHRPGRRDGRLVTASWRKPAFCARSGTRAYAWGEGSKGALGTSSSTDRLRPAPVKDLRGVTQVLGSSNTAYALCRNGTVWAWGSNIYGELGNGKTGDRRFPVRVRGLSGVTQIAARRLGGVALRSDGTVWSWGWGNYGQLGDGRPFSSSRVARTPVRVAGLSNVTQIAAGGYGAYALLSDGTLKAWGNGGLGRLGNNSSTDTSTPVDVDTLASVTKVASGHDTGYALRSNGEVWSWGNDGQGQLGNGAPLSNVDQPVLAGMGGATVVDIAAAYAAAYALAATGTVRTWGSGRHHDVGFDNGGNPQPASVSNVTLAEITDLAGFGYGGYALSETGVIWGWGDHGAGQAGTGAAPTGPSYTEGVNPPTALPGGGGFRSIGAGQFNGYAIR
ncbi:MAG: hypothetical protein Q8O61_19780 [Nocardioides sp.]|nr:hypothetical protein [Nocardioides sp.]